MVAINYCLKNKNCQWPTHVLEKGEAGCKEIGMFNYMLKTVTRYEKKLSATFF